MRPWFPAAVSSRLWRPRASRSAAALLERQASGWPVLSPTGLCRGAGRAHGRHIEHQCELPGGGQLWPPARAGTQLWQREKWGVLARPQPLPGPRGGRAGARNCLACDGHRYVQGGNRSPGCERGKRRPWHGGGCAAGPSSRAKRPIFELWRRTVYFALQMRITYKARGRGTRTFVFPPGSLYPCSFRVNFYYL